MLLSWEEVEVEVANGVVVNWFTERAEAGNDAAVR